MKKSNILAVVLFAFTLFFNFFNGNLYAAGHERNGGSPLQASEKHSRRIISDRPGNLLIVKKSGVRQENPPAAGLVAEHGKHRLSFSYQGVDYSRSFTAEKLPLQEEMLIGVDYDAYDLIYQYELVNLRNSLAGLSLGLIGQFKLMEGQTELLTDGRRRKEDFNASIPLIGLNLHMGIIGDLLEGRVRATGMGYNHGNIFDGQAEFSLYPNHFLDIYGGYRFYLIDIETEEAKLDHDKSGPYLGITLSF